MSSIGFVLPAHYCFSRGNGIREEALLKSRGLAVLGHRFDLLDPWRAIERGSLDVVHFFYGGLPLANIAAVRQIEPRRLIFSTIIDSNQRLASYRFAAWLGGIAGRIH